ncbi:hypothetical protein FNYG_00080 [Fusarium nygamai]|uniref:Uncharacterized protein n=1 Tax=Gibberella nygamai TaxID=42673 RepID=A0A2K0WVS5_GIBNY|nr:hypothetical protein FNYG_00080 [Fusarium nygamai]
MNATCFENSLRRIKPTRRPPGIDDESTEDIKASEDGAQERGMVEGEHQTELGSNASYEPESDESGKASDSDSSKSELGDNPVSEDDDLDMTY